MGFSLALGRASESWGTRGRPLKPQTPHLPKDRSHTSSHGETQTVQTPEITELGGRLTASPSGKAFWRRQGLGRSQRRQETTTVDPQVSLAAPAGPPTPSLRSRSTAATRMPPGAVIPSAAPAGLPPIPAPTTPPPRGLLKQHLSLHPDMVPCATAFLTAPLPRT